MGKIKELPTSINQKFENTVYDLLKFIEDEPNREGLLDTPRRVRESLQYLTSGYKEDPLKVLNSALFESDNREMVLIQDIEFNSLCEHHLLPFTGVCHVAYIPNGKIVGLSKISRLVDIFSRRLQVQERLVDDIAKTLKEGVGARGVAVMAKAKHMCMQMRGVEKCMPTTQSSSYLGEFLTNYNLKQEFLMGIS